MSTDLKISQLTPATTVNTNDFTVMVDGNTSANKRATVAQILAIAGAGTVTSINVSGANGINSSGGPITSSGTIALSLGAITPTSIVASGTISGSNLSNTNTGDQAITIVGDVTAPASTGTLTTTLANSVVTNDKLANMVGPTVKGRTSGTGIPQDLSTAQVTAMLPEMVADSGTGGTKGLVPPPTAGSAAAKKFLRADATWVATDLNDILPSQSGNSGKVLQTSGTTTSWQAVGVGSVTSVSVVSSGGVSGSVATSTTTPAISLTLGAITPTSVNSVVVSGSSTPTLAVTGTSSISNANTGDQTTITGNAGSATALATGRTIAIIGDLAYTSPSFDGTANVTATGTLATVASAGTTGSSTAIPIVTINAKGLTTSITTAAVIAPAGTLSGNTLASGVTASSLTSLGTIANLAVTAGTISGTPSASTDIANKLYVDTVAQGLDAKASCVAATTANITLSAAQTIDGISVIAGNRVLVKNQTLSQNNGIYLCASGAWTRTTDADTWDELTSAFTFIETGTVNADTGYVCTANAGGTLGTTALPWSQFSGAGSYTASTGLTLTGTAFSLTAPVTVALGGTASSSAGIGSFNNITGFTAAGATGTTSTNLVFSTSPTLVTPALGTPSSGTLTSCTGLPLSTGITGTLPAANGGTGVANNAAMTVTGSGNFAYTRTLTAATNVTFPTTGTLATLAGSETLTNKTITGGIMNGTLGATTPSSVAATTGTFSSTLSVTGVATLGNGAILGTPTSGTVTNLTGTASININGTVGATTAASGSFTSLQATTSGQTSTIALTDTGANGANLRFIGDGATTPNKYIRAQGGQLQFLNSAYSAVIAALTDAGSFSAAGINSTPIGATTPSTGAFTTVGVGAAATSGTLHVTSAGGAVGDYQLALTRTSVGTTTLRVGGSNELIIAPNGTDRASFTTSGAAITGTLSATGQLTVTGAAQNPFGSTFTPTAWGTSSIDINNASGGILAVYYGGTAKGYFAANSGTAAISLNTQGDGTINQNVNGTTRASVTSTGLAVTGVVTAGVAKMGTGFAGFAEFSDSTRFGASGTYSFLSETGGTSTYVNASTGGNVYLRIANADKAVVSSTGLAVTGALSCTGDFTAASGTAFLTKAGGNALYLNRNTNDGTVVDINRGGSSVGSISVTTTATAYNTSSDYRLKNVDGPVVDSGTFIDALKPRAGTWKVDGSKFVGFLAHEFAEVSPLSVSGEKDAVDADGKPVYQSMQAGTSEVIANLVAELQSLRKRLAALESK